MSKNVEVRGGYMSGGNEDKDSRKSGTKEKSNAVFMEKRSEVVPEDKLAAFFRRDWDMCSMPTIIICPTNKQVTIHF